VRPKQVIYWSNYMTRIKRRIRRKIKARVLVKFGPVCKPQTIQTYGVLEAEFCAFNLGMRRRRVASFTLEPLFP
jgi:hypothetical protein